MSETNITRNLIDSILIVILIGFVNTLYPIIIGLIYTAEIMGKVAIVMSWINFASIPIVNGIAPAIARFIAASEEKDDIDIEETGTKSSTLYLSIILIPLLIIEIFVFSLDYITIIPILLILIFNVFHYLYRKALQGREDFILLRNIQLISFLIFIPFCVLSLVFSRLITNDISVLVLMVPVLVYHISFCIIFFVKRRDEYTLNFKDIIKKRTKKEKDIYIYALQVGAASLFSLGITQIQIPLSSIYLSDFEIGVLGFWTNAIALLTLLAIAMTSMLVSRISNLLKQDRKVADSFTRDTNWAIHLIFLPLSALLMAIIAAYPSFLDVLTFDKYRTDLYWLVVVLLAFQIISYLVATPIRCYFLSDKSLLKWVIISTGISSIVTIIGWIVAVPSLGIFGFAIGIAIGGFVLNIAYQLIAFIISKTYFGKQMFYYIVQSMVIAGCIAAIYYTNMSLIVVILLSILASGISSYGIYKLIKTMRIKKYNLKV